MAPTYSRAVQCTLLLLLFTVTIKAEQESFKCTGTMAVCSKNAECKLKVAENATTTSASGITAGATDATTATEMTTANMTAAGTTDANTANETTAADMTTAGTTDASTANETTAGDTTAAGTTDASTATDTTAADTTAADTTSNTSSMATYDCKCKDNYLLNKANSVCKVNLLPYLIGVNLMVGMVVAGILVRLCLIKDCCGRRLGRKQQLQNASPYAPSYLPVTRPQFSAPSQLQFNQPASRFNLPQQSLYQPPPRFNQPDFRFARYSGNM